jgi:hypothetical protein
MTESSRAADCVTNEMFSGTCPETEYRLDVCRATNGAIFRSVAHIKNFARYSALKMYPLLQYILWLKGYTSIMFYFTAISGRTTCAEKDKISGTRKKWKMYAF